MDSECSAWSRTVSNIKMKNHVCEKATSKDLIPDDVAELLSSMYTSISIEEKRVRVKVRTFLP